MRGSSVSSTAGSLTCNRCCWARCRVTDPPAALPLPPSAVGAALGGWGPSSWHAYLLLRPPSLKRCGLLAMNPLSSRASKRRLCPASRCCSAVSGLRLPSCCPPQARPHPTAWHPPPQGAAPELQQALRGCLHSVLQHPQVPPKTPHTRVDLYLRPLPHEVICFRRTLSVPIPLLLLLLLGCLRGPPYGGVYHAGRDQRRFWQQVWSLFQPTEGCHPPAPPTKSHLPPADSTWPTCC